MLPSVVHWDGVSDPRLLSLLYASLHPQLSTLSFSLPFLQGEPGKAGEKGLAGAPGLRVSALFMVCGLVLVEYRSGTGGVSP